MYEYKLYCCVYCFVNVAVDDDQMSVASGYVAQLVVLLFAVFSMRPWYPLTVRGSRSLADNHLLADGLGGPLDSALTATALDARQRAQRPLSAVAPRSGSDSNLALAQNEPVLNLKDMKVVANAESAHSTSSTRTYLTFYPLCIRSHYRLYMYFTFLNFSFQFLCSAPFLL